jgi:hypothetical protein
LCDEESRWARYDDSHVREIDGGWFEILQNLVEGLIQPVLLIFERSEKYLPKVQLLNDTQLLVLSLKYHVDE